MASVLSNVYNTLFKRNTIYLGSIFIGAFAMEIAFDTTSNKIWDAINRGRQWKDIKHRYMEKEDDDE